MQLEEILRIKRNQYIDQYDSRIVKKEIFCVNPSADKIIGSYEKLLTVAIEHLDYRLRIYSVMWYIVNILNHHEGDIQLILCVGARVPMGNATPHKLKLNYHTGCL